MSITPGSIVELVDPIVSTKGGVLQHLDRGTKGRACRVMDFFCCVQFSGAGCRRVAKHHLRVATGTAPACTAACTGGC